MSKKLLVVPFAFSLLLVFWSAAFAYPSAKNERFVIRSMRTIHAAQATYSQSVGAGNYGFLWNLGQAQLIDSVLATNQKYGYYFQTTTVAATATTPARYFVTARPSRYRKAGVKSFYIDQTGVLRGADKNGAAATASDPEIDDDCLPFEECAIGNLRTLHGAQIAYGATIGNGGYATFAQLHAANLIGASLADGSYHGYNFTGATNNQTTPATFYFSAVPVSYGATGRRSFYVGTDGVLRGADKNGAPADENDPPIQ